VPHANVQTSNNTYYCVASALSVMRLAELPSAVMYLSFTRAGYSSSQFDCVHLYVVTSTTDPGGDDDDDVVLSVLVAPG